MNPIEKEAILVGLFITILLCVLISSKSENRFFKQFYKYIPTIFLLLFIPAFLNSIGIINGNSSKLHKISSNFLLPAALVLLASTADIKSIISLGRKSLLTFLGSTVAIVFALPLAYLMACWTIPNFKQDAAQYEYFKILPSICGSWVGGSSSQISLQQIYGASAEIFAISLLVDAIAQSIWTTLLTFGIGFKEKIDNWLGANNQYSIEELKKNISSLKGDKDRPADLIDLVKILTVGFGGAALAHLLAGSISNMASLKPYLAQYNYLILILFATTLGIGLSFKKQFRQLDKLGSGDVSQIIIYFLILTIGMQIDFGKLGGNLSLYLMVFIWLFVQAIISISFAKMLRANYFFYATGSQANFGGVATASALASMFHPSLGIVGALLGVLSTIIGTYAGMIAAWLLQMVI